MLQADVKQLEVYFAKCSACSKCSPAETRDLLNMIWPSYIFHVDGTYPALLKKYETKFLRHRLTHL